MAQRIELQALLEDLLGSSNVYFQPPSNIQMTYPCIVYNKDNLVVQHAANFPYRITKRYSITVIDRDPDSWIPDEVAKLPMCDFVRRFSADNLNHDIFNLYF